MAFHILTQIWAEQHVGWLIPVLLHCSDFLVVGEFLGSPGSLFTMVWWWRVSPGWCHMVQKKGTVCCSKGKPHIMVVCVWCFLYFFYGQEHEWILYMIREILFKCAREFLFHYYFEHSICLMKEHWLCMSWFRWLAYPHTPLRKIEVVICNHQVNSPFHFFTDGDLQAKKKYDHTRHQMSSLRPGLCH